jgi:hypothetical protein
MAATQGDHLTRLQILDLVRKNAETLVYPDTPTCKYDPHLLCGMCGYCALAVEIAFRHYGYNNCRSYYGSFLYYSLEYPPKRYNHCWTECYDTNKIYDITATQFGKDPVYVTRLDNDLYERHEVIRVEDRGFWSLWSDQQRPTPSRLKTLLRDVAALPEQSFERCQTSSLSQMR